MMNGIRLLKVLVCAPFLAHTQAWAFDVMPSLNCNKKDTAENAIIRLTELKSDGAWFITQNSDFKDSEWQAIFQLLGGRGVSEDNPDSSKSYNDYVRIVNKPPDGSMCYNETGGLPGGTLLSDSQIDAQFQSHGNRPIICLTRSYGGKWREETDRCLKNPKVCGICMEYVKEALLDNINAPAECIRAVLKEDKRVYILLHAAGEGWTLEENRKIISNLNSWCPEGMQIPDVCLVYQNYDISTPGRFGSGGVKDAIDQACEMPNYAGKRKNTNAALAVCTYAELSSCSARGIPVQARPFWFTLGGGEGSAPHAPTLEKAPLADHEPPHCGVGEWEYSFHHLKNGQEDGAGQKRYGGYPSPPQNRSEALDCVRRYYMRLREEALTKATADERTLFQSINGHYCYQHYACEWGCDLVGSEVGENINSIQMHIAFTRGAARQYGKPWLMDFSSWYGPSMFDEDPRHTWGDNSGPTHGHSLSLHTRTYYVSYMAGANIGVAEGGWLNCFKSQQPGPDGTLPLSLLGEKAAEFYRFTRRHPGRGIPYTPVALVLPFDHGIYPGFAPKLSWNAFPYTPGDQRILDALNILFPGSLGDPDQPERADQQPGNPSWKDPDYMRTEALRLVASPYGDIADVLLANAQADVLRSYPVLVLAGDFASDSSLAQRLGYYVANGGTLVVDQADKASGILTEELTALLPSPLGAAFAQSQHGKGNVVALSSSSPSQPTAERPLAKALAKLTRDLVPFEVSGRVETLYSRTEEGWVITVLNNEGVTKTFLDPPVIDPNAVQTVTIHWRGEEEVRSAVLWGVDTDQELDLSRMCLSVPPGEVRIVSLCVGKPTSPSPGI